MWASLAGEEDGAAAKSRHSHVPSRKPLRSRDRKYAPVFRSKKEAVECTLKVVEEMEWDAWTSSRRFEFVSTVDALHRAIDEFSRCQMVGIDVEHFAGRGRVGFVTLIQLSGGDLDVVVDCMVPEVRKCLGRCLRVLFCRRDLVIVGHGLNTDARWLHRDFGVRLRGCVIDTELLAREGHRSRLGLKSLLQAELGIARPDKKLFQAADWRVRPLPPAMMAYARSDTMYLGPLVRRLLASLPPDQHFAGIMRARIVSDATWSFASSEVWCGDASLELWRFVLEEYSQHSATSSTGGLAVPRAIQSMLEDKRFCAAALAAWRWRYATARRWDEPDVFIASNHDLIAAAKAVATSSQLPKLYTIRAAQRVLHQEGRMEGKGTPLRPDGATWKARMSDSAILSGKKCISKELEEGVLEKWSGGKGSEGGVGLVERVERVLLGAVNSRSFQSHATSLASDALGSTVAEDERAVERAAAILPRTSPLYSNIELRDTDGTILARIGAKKARWYREKDAVEELGIVGAGTPDERFVIQLRVPARGRGHPVTDFHCQRKRNECVVCGSVSELTRFYIVPRVFRYNFPMGAKSYTSHDIVLLCTRCHRLASKVIHQNLQDISSHMKVPMSKKMARDWNGGSSCVEEDAEIRLLRIGAGYARALEQPKKKKSRIPEDRLASMRKGIEDAMKLLTEEERAKCGDSLSEIHSTLKAAANTRQLHGTVDELDDNDMEEKSEGDGEGGEGREGCGGVLLALKAMETLESPTAPPEATEALDSVQYWDLLRFGARVVLLVRTGPVAACERELYSKWCQEELKRENLAEEEVTIGDRGVSLAEERRLSNFVMGLRAAFVARCKPKHLPEAWDVHYEVLRSTAGERDVRDPIPPTSEQVQAVRERIQFLRDLSSKRPPKSK